jgi:DNA-binding transcriptional regulator/RsmH inhibitor MraZ
MIPTQELLDAVRAVFRDELDTSAFLEDAARWEKIALQAREIRRLRAELRTLRRMLLGFAERIYLQSELLSRKAEKVDAGRE